MTGETMQEKAWAGEFGDAYHERSPGNEEANFYFFRKVLYLNHMSPHRVIVPNSLIELGAGTGANLRPLHRLFPDLPLTGLELNAAACEKLDEIPKVSTLHMPLSRLYEDPLHPLHRTWDMVLSKGFLIHIPPEDLTQVYATIHALADRWILMAEYYNPKPQEIPYRGAAGMLWKRDFAGEMLDTFPDLRLLDYGFVYHRDPNPQDDLTWFLLEKVR